jgi:hypothetical protein
LRTATDILLAHASAIRGGVHELLDRSGMTQMDRDWGSAVWLGPTGEWAKLDIEGRRVQSRVLEEYRRFFETVRVLLRGQPPDALRELEEADAALREILEQSQLSWLGSVDDAHQRALSAIDAQCSLLTRLHDAGDGTDVYVPDTNALLHNLDLENWAFPDSAKFELVLGPSVLVELDELKVNHRNPDVRQKAESLISRIKGYRSRGRLTEGVPLRSSVSTIRAMPTEPRLDESLSWLDPANCDDRFIATVIELIRQRPRSAITTARPRSACSASAPWSCRAACCTPTSSSSSAPWTG